MFEQTLNAITNDPNSGITDPGKPSDLIAKLLPYVFGVAGIVLLINIISAGLKLMTSQGDPKAIGAAQAKLTTSGIGILILFGAYWIARLIFDFLGIGTNTLIFN